MYDDDISMGQSYASLNKQIETSARNVNQSHITHFTHRLPSYSPHYQRKTCNVAQTKITRANIFICLMMQNFINFFYTDSIVLGNNLKKLQAF